jgi:hypothetical protein
MVTIGRCRKDDVADVLDFIGAHWKPGHIFTLHRQLFEWQHARRDQSDDYSFAIARSSDRELVGVLGYMSTCQFDPALAAANTIWLALWSVRDDWKASGVGLRLLKFVVDQEAASSGMVGVIGFAESVRPLYEAMGFRVGELRHYVMLNPDVGTFELARFSPAATADAGIRVAPGAVRATPLTRDGNRQVAVTGRAQIPAKTAAYFRARYLNHPVYQYRCDVVERDGHAIGLVATRLAEHEHRKALRIVDYFGPDDDVPSIGALIRAQVRDAGAEFADVYNWGIDADLFRRAGFTEVRPEGPDIVPDHFEPFERRNIRIRFAVKTSRPVVLFKGDGDQDRPNRLPT